ncbi:sporulation protein [Bacillus sp. CBEL-1]|nr:sporulation protein [Bacillus sp. CBEL-1]
MQTFSVQMHRIKKKFTNLKEVRSLIPRRPSFPPRMQSPFGPTNTQQTFFPNTQGINPQGTPRGPGNLLARIFGRGRAGARGTEAFGGSGAAGAQRMIPPTSLFNTVQSAATPASSASLLSNLQNLTNPATLSSMMTNIQKVIKVAETMGPMVQQYGPLVKNAPSLIKMYQLLRTADTGEEEEDDASNNSEEKNNEGSTQINNSKENENEKEKKLESDEFNFDDEEIKPVKKVRQSTPKLYI